MTSRVNRRQLLIGTGAAAAAAAIPAQGAQAADRWDLDCDILCVGSGAAGGTAAVIAAAEGAKVIMIDKMPVLGGTTAKSSGLAWIFDNFAMRQGGIADPKADALRYAVRMGFPTEYDPASPTLGLDELRYRTVEAFYDHGAATIDRLKQLGVVEFRQFRMFNYDRLAADYGDHLPENKAPAGRALDPIGGSQMGGGFSLTAQLAAFIEKNGMPVLLETRATRILKDAGDRVIGIEADQAGKPIRIRARKGVIFGTGGFVLNAELCELHQPPIYATCALPGATGDFLPLAQEAGARMGNLGLGWRGQFLLGEALESRGVPWGMFMAPGDSSILVNKYGRRCVNEKRDYNDRTKAHFHFDASMVEYPNHLMFLLFDARALDMFGGAFPIPVKPSEQPLLVQGADWAAVARGLDAQLARWSGRTGGVRLADSFVATLGQTISAYNGYAHVGHDPEYRRGDFQYDRDWDLLFSPHRAGTKQTNPFPNKQMHPIADKGPYYGIILAPGALDTAGGPQINAHAQVLAADGKPIPGLYGAGNCISAPTGNGYLGGGGTIGPAMTFGYIAARHAMKG
jgi:3-oxosteroid 1-dehydrogenase